MAKNDSIPSRTAQKEQDVAGAKPTTVDGANEAGTNSFDGGLGGSPAAADGDRVNLDPESDLGKAAAVDAAHSGGAIRAEDNAGEGRQPDGAAEASGAGTDPSIGEKITVETTGDFMLHDPYSLDTIPSEGSAEVAYTAFIESKLAAGQLVKA